MTNMTPEEVKNVVPKSTARRQLGDYYDLLRYFEAHNKTLTQKGINLFLQEGISFVNVWDVYYIDEVNTQN